MKKKDGSYNEYTAKIYPFLTHEQTKKNFVDDVSFEITQVEFQSSISTYLDSPYHRFPDRSDISKISLSQLILPGVLINVLNSKSGKEYDLVDQLENKNLEGKAVLVNFGWSKYFGTEKYYSYPFISEGTIDFLVENNAGIVGVDTINIDNDKNLRRPAHTKLLRNDVLIVENLLNLEKLSENDEFIFYAIPVRTKNAAAMPIRAFAQV